MTTPCAVCGKPESEHHEFVPVRAMPAGCKCDPEEWDDGPLPICDSYKGLDGDYCKECCHDKECHDG
jgi:hypothetical protein